MIKINIIAVGKLKEKYLRDACDEYKKRLSAYANFNTVEVNEYKSDDVSQVLKKEGELIIAKIPKGSYVIPMCIEGRQLSSEEIAKKIEEISLENSEITFIIGGSFGLSDEVKALGDLKLSFGKITLPHQLMRVVLSEQIYRAFSILNNSKYHK